MSTSVTVKFPIDQNEQAKQLKAEHLLPQDVYLKIASLIEVNLTKLEKMKDKNGMLDDIDECRAHETILIDGGRGAGKSSVLVNLEMFLKDDKCNKTGLKADDLLILKPVDPTLVENGDSLLLNIIVAALMRNKEVIKKLDKSDDKADHFYEQLQKLGGALEAVETQKSKHGIDKLRSFMGGHGLAQNIHKLFKSTLKLTDKKLIILPIDDVDTSLHHAFDNIEIVRKYLSSPYLIPIVSGDLALYGEIIWRNFHGRIVKDSKLDEALIKPKALELQKEYQRKIMPFNRRIIMHDHNYYAKQQNIKLVGSSNKLINSNNEATLCLPTIFNWLDIVVHGLSNGKENSKLSIPIHSIRETSQFIGLHKNEILQLAEVVKDTDLATSKSFAKKIVEGINCEKKELDTKGRKLLDLQTDWLMKCRDYFKYEEKGGPIYLISKASSDWVLLNSKSRLFETELFSPLQHKINELKLFDKKYQVRGAWKKELEDRLQGTEWFETIIENSILPYPVPEKGLRVPELNKSLNDLITELDKNLENNSVILFKNEGHSCETPEEQLEFICSLMLNKNYYTTFQQSTLLCSGRVLELIILSLIKNIEVEDVKTVLQEQPFYSLAYFAPTKPLSFDKDKEKEDGLDESDNDKESSSEFNKIFLKKFVDEINQWRNNYISSMVSPWLVYNVFNKYFNQVHNFNDPEKSLTYVTPLLKVSNKLQQSFNCLWSCFGSFEKGEVFVEADSSITFQNIGETTRFNKANWYHKNIAPLLEEKGKGSITHALQYHPLKILINTLNLKEFTLDELTEKQVKSTGDQNSKATFEFVIQKHLKKVTLSKIQSETELSEENVKNIYKHIDEDIRKASIEAQVEFTQRIKEVKQKLKEGKIELNHLPLTWKGKLDAILVRNKLIQS